jgi:hypothetical protein
MAAWRERKRLLAEQHKSSARGRRGASAAQVAVVNNHEEQVRTDVEHNAYHTEQEVKRASRDTRAARMLALRAALRQRRLAAAA